MKTVKKIFVGNFRYTALIIILACLPYLNSFDCSFQLDDYHIIQKNSEIGNLERFSRIDSWKNPFYNRQLTNLTYSINYLIHGYELFGYHLFNLLIHVVNSLLVFYFILYLFETEIIKKNKIYQHKVPVSLFTAFIFAVHPIQVQAVTYITQRMVSIAILFYISSMIFYLKARLDTGEKNKLAFISSLVCFLLGIYSKEIVFSLPVTILFIELLFFRNHNNKIELKYVLTLFSIIIVGAVILFVKFGLPRQPYAPEPYFYALTQLTVLVTYVRLLFVPIHQHLYYMVDVSKSFFDLNVILSCLILSSIVLTGFFFYKKNRLITFGIGWFFITQAIESSIFPLKFLLFEYRIYPAVLGYGLIISILSFSYIKKTEYSVIILSLITITYGVMTYNHNFVWKNPIALWTNNVEQTPKYAVAYNNLATQYMMQNDFPKAFENFSKAIKLDSSYAEPYSQRAVIYCNLGDYNSAMKDASRAIKINSKNALYLNNRGYVFQSMGNFDSAIIDFKKAIELEPRYDNAIKNLSVIYYFQNKQSEAMEYANLSIKLDSTKADYYNNRGNIYFAINDYESAEKDFRKAISISPDYPKAVNNIGVIKLKQNRLDEAIQYFTKTIQADDRFIDAYYYRGYCLLLKNMKELAYQDLRQCLLIFPNHPGAMSLIKQFFETANRK